MDCEKADSSSMLPRRKDFAYDEGNKCYQITAAFVVCFVCICGGNVSGFTSSAIPSMRQASYRIDKICNSSSGFMNVSSPGPKVVIGIPSLKINVDLDTSNGGFDEYADNVDCKTFTVENVNEFQYITDTQASWIGGLAPLGAFLGSLVASVSVKAFGPKSSILFFACPMFLISWITTALAQSVFMVYIARFFGGTALGLTVSSAPLYIMDTASISLRGPLGTLAQFLYSIGVLISFILGSFLNWRQLAWTSSAVVVPGIFFLMLIPESPVWLLSKNRMEETEYAFHKMHGRSADFKFFLESHFEAHTDVNQNTDEDERSGISFLWKLNKAERKSCFVAFSLCIFQQLCGINGVNYYTLSIFKAAAEGSAVFVLNGHISSIIVAAVFCSTTLPSYILIERCGRKPLLLSSIALMVVSSAGLGTYFYIKESVEDSGAFRMIPLACLITYVLAFSIGFGPILYILVAEVLSPEIRPVFSPMAVGVNWLTVFAVTKTFPDLIAVTGIHGAFWLYATMSVLGLIFVIFCVPETKGKTEKEIEKYFWRGSTNSRKILMHAT